MTEAEKATLESKCMLVESEYFTDTTYAIERRGKGMFLIYKNIMVPIAAENIQPLAAEMIAVWDTMRPRTVR
jgi:hypothetical protein